MSLLIFFSGSGGAAGEGLPLPVEFRVDLSLGGSYRGWLRDSGTCERHWFLGDVATVQCRDEISDDASGDGIYSGGPVSNRGILPEYGLSTAFDGIDDSVAVSSGLTGTGGVFTLAALVRPGAEGMGTDRTIVKTGGAGAATLGINAANNPFFGAIDGDAVASTVAIEAGRTYLVVGSYDGEDAAIFVADLEANTLTETGPLTLSFAGAHGSGVIGNAA
jgi:hypothetical protein